jgi:hypothetical protein
MSELARYPQCRANFWKTLHLHDVSLWQTMCEPEKQRDRHDAVGYFAFTAISEDLDHTEMARALRVEIGDQQFVYPKRQELDRSVEVQSGQTVKGAYERRITRSQSDLHGQHNESSQMYHEWLRPASPRHLADQEGCNIDRSADNTMEIPLTPVEDLDSTPGSRNDPVRLSRRAAMKRNSTKDRKTKTERHDNTVQSTCAPEKASARTPAIRPTAETPPSNLRRFSFELTARDDAIKTFDTLDFEHVPITPAAIAELECHPALALEYHRHVRASVELSRPQLFAQAQQIHRETGEERDQTAELRDLDRERRRVLTTFDKILGERKIPTALL